MSEQDYKKLGTVLQNLFYGELAVIAILVILALTLL